MTQTVSPVFFTICTHHTLAQARALRASVSVHHPGARFVLVCADQVAQQAGDVDGVVAPERLGVPALADMRARYTAAQLRAALKPFVFAHLFDEGAADAIYLDPTGFVCAPMREIVASLGAQTDAILTPHLLRPAEGVRVGDLQMLQMGAYHLGVLALHASARVREIVRWWGRRVEAQCEVDVAGGLYLDQKWASLLPSYIPDTLVLHHPGYHLGCWNLHQRRLSADGEGWRVDGEPLVFVNFGGDPVQCERTFCGEDPEVPHDTAQHAAMLYTHYLCALRGDPADGASLQLPVPSAAPPAAQPAVVSAVEPAAVRAASSASPSARTRRVRNALVTLRRARAHAGGWSAMALKGAAVFRRGGVRLMRDTLRELNRTHPGVSASRAQPDDALRSSNVADRGGAMVQADPPQALPPTTESLQALRTQVEAEWSAKLHAARAEASALWSQRVVAARVETAAQLSRQVGALHAQIVGQWSEQLAAADAAGWPARPHGTVSPAAACAPARVASEAVGAAPRGRILLMSHDAQAHGAQYLALSLTREFRTLGFEVEVLMQGGGWLEPQFSALAPVHRLYTLGAEGRRALADDLVRRGFRALIANTTVTGLVIREFADAGLRIVSLIHELPVLVAGYGLEQARETLADVSERLVVPARPVWDGLVDALGETRLAGKLVTRPQGLYTRNRYRGLTDMSEPRRRLRERLGLPATAAVVLCVGYADLRKGADLLAEAAVIACGRRADVMSADVMSTDVMSADVMRADVHVVWVGHADAALRAEIEARMAQAGLSSHFVFAGLDFDTDDYFAGADVYALTSREDPFPSVVMESLAVGVPVVAFAGTGGCADLVAGGEVGFAVPAFDVQAYADALLRLVDDPALRTRLGDAGRALIDREFGFRRYALDVLAMVGLEVAQVSAVVPNYNYARYLPERIDSIAAQRHPVMEIVALDDASGDDSVEVLRLQRMYVQPEPVIVPSATNSGSVFRQWLAGVRRASGEFVWIAEADDAADPALIETLLPAMRADPSIVMGYVQSSRVDAAGCVIAEDYLGWTDDLSVERWRAPYVATGAEEAEAGLAVKNTVPNVSAALFRRAPLLATLERHIAELETYRVAGDWLVYLYLLREGRIHYAPQVLNRHRYHGGSVTGSLDAQRHYDEVVAVQRIAGTLYPLSAPTRARADAYAQHLRTHFGL